MKNIFRFLFVVFLIFTTTNLMHAQWQMTSVLPPYDVRSLAVSGSIIYAGVDGRGVWFTGNKGENFTCISDTSFKGNQVWSLSISGMGFFAGTDQGVFRYTGGTRWIQSNTGMPIQNPDVRALAVSDGYLIAGTYVSYDTRPQYHGGVLFSPNNGESWTVSELAPVAVFSLAVSGNHIFAGSGLGFFYSTDYGISWTAANTGLTNNDVISLGISGGSLFAGTGGGVFRSTLDGTDWTEANNGLTNLSTLAFTTFGTFLFAGTNGGVFLSTNNGANWTDVSEGLWGWTWPVYALAISGSDLYAGTYSGVWRRPLSEMLTSVSAEGGSTNMPTHFTLDQNYPNPFNPTTSISFDLPSRSMVSLKVFDMLGREVAAIVSEEMSAGSYLKQWNAVALPSGVYFYRLQADNFSDTKKIILMK